MGTALLMVTTRCFNRIRRGEISFGSTSTSTETQVLDWAPLTRPGGRGSSST